MKNLLLLLITLFIVNSAQAQSKFIMGYSDIPFANNPSFTPNDVVQIAGGGYMFCVPSANTGSGFLIKTDNTGSAVSTFTTGNSSIAGPASVYITLAANNKFYCAGNYLHIGNAVDSFFVMKADASNTVIWKKAFATQDASLTKIITTNDDGVLLLMQLGLITETFGTLIKLDANGTIQWQKAITNVPYFNVSLSAWKSGSTTIYDVFQTSSNDYLVCGNSYSADTKIGNFITKVSSTGAVMWTRKIHTSAFIGVEFPKVIAELGNGNIKVVIEKPVGGGGLSNFAILDLSSTGSLITANGYQETGSGYNTINDAFISSSGDVLVSLDSKFIKVFNNGTLDFCYSYSNFGPSVNIYGRVLNTADGGYITQGWYGTLFQDQAAFLLKTASDGTTTSGYYSSCGMSPVAYTSSDSAAVLVDSTISKEITTGTLSFTAAATVLDTLFASTVGIQEPKQNGDTSLFPNPFSGQLTIELSNHGQATFTLYDVFSRQVLQQPFTNSTTINTAQFANGIYFYELRNEKGVVRKGKVIKQ